MPVSFFCCFRNLSELRRVPARVFCWCTYVFCIVMPVGPWPSQLFKLKFFSSDYIIQKNGIINIAFEVFSHHPTFAQLVPMFSRANSSLLRLCVSVSIRLFLTFVSKFSYCFLLSSRCSCAIQIGSVFTNAAQWNGALRHFSFYLCSLTTAVLTRSPLDSSNSVASRILQVSRNDAAITN